MRQVLRSAFRVSASRAQCQWRLAVPDVVLYAKARTLNFLPDVTVTTTFVLV